MNVETYEKARTEYLAADAAYTVATADYFAACKTHNVDCDGRFAFVTHDTEADVAPEIRAASEALTAAREAYYTTARAVVAAHNEVSS